MKDELGFDGAINYKTETITEGLKREAPDGVDCYFDNVGGDVLDQVMGQMNTFGRIAFCGAIAQYGELENKVPGPSNWKMMLMRRITLQGFVCVDHVKVVGFVNHHVDCFQNCVQLGIAGEVLGVRPSGQRSGISPRR